MSIKRVGFLVDIEDDSAPHLHKSAVIVARKPHDMPRYGRAVAGHLGQKAGYARIPDVAACVVWGCSDADVAKQIIKGSHATMLIALPKRPKSDSKIMEAIRRVAVGGSNVEVIIISAKTKAFAWDVGIDKYCKKAADIRRPPQGQVAPSIPEKYRKKPVEHTVQAPSTSHLRRE